MTDRLRTAEYKPTAASSPQIAFTPPTNNTPSVRFASRTKVATIFGSSPVSVGKLMQSLEESSAQVRQKGFAPPTFAFDRHCRFEGDAKAKVEGA